MPFEADSRCSEAPIRMPHSTNGLGEAGKLVYRSFPGLRAHVRHHDRFCHHRGRNSNGRAVPTHPTVARAAQLGILGGMLVIGGGAGWQQLSWNSQPRTLTARLKTATETFGAESTAVSIIISTCIVSAWRVNTRTLRSHATTMLSLIITFRLDTFTVVLILFC